MNSKSLSKTPLGTKSGLTTLTKARFGAGMLLQHDDLDALANYTQDLNRLMFRTLLGCGVMCGLVVRVDPPKCGKLTVRVGKGLALDACGDPIAVNEKQTIEIDTGCDADLKQLWVVLCATTKCCAPRASMCAGGDDDDPPSVATRERYGFEIRIVRERPECACGCAHDDELHEGDCSCANPEASCYSDHYDGLCGDGCDCGGDCGCDCVVLARLDKESDEEASPWLATHKVRRFIRPVLIEDPQARIEYEQRKVKSDKEREEQEKEIKVAMQNLDNATLSALAPDTQAQAAAAADLLFESEPTPKSAKATKTTKSPKEA